jgi:hypothetical protein
MSRPRNPDKLISISIRFDPATEATLSALACRKRTTRSQVVRLLVSAQMGLLMPDRKG